MSLVLSLACYTSVLLQSPALPIKPMTLADQQKGQVTFLADGGAQAVQAGEGAQVRIPAGLLVQGREYTIETADAPTSRTVIAGLANVSFSITVSPKAAGSLVPSATSPGATVGGLEAVLPRRDQGRTQAASAFLFVGKGEDRVVWPVDVTPTPNSFLVRVQGEVIKQFADAGSSLAEVEFSLGVFTGLTEVQGVGKLEEESWEIAKQGAEVVGISSKQEFLENIDPIRWEIVTPQLGGEGGPVKIMRFQNGRFVEAASRSLGRLTGKIAFLTHGLTSNPAGTFGTPSAPGANDSYAHRLEKEGYEVLAASYPSPTPDIVTRNSDALAQVLKSSGLKRVDLLVSHSLGVPVSAGAFSIAKGIAVKEARFFNGPIDGTPLASSPNGLISLFLSGTLNSGTSIFASRWKSELKRLLDELTPANGAAAKACRQFRTSHPETKVTLYVGTKFDGGPLSEKLMFGLTQPFFDGLDNDGVIPVVSQRGTRAFQGLEVGRIEKPQNHHFHNMVRL